MICAGRQRISSRDWWISCKSRLGRQALVQSCGAKEKRETNVRNIFKGGVAEHVMCLRYQRRLLSPLFTNIRFPASNSGNPFLRLQNNNHPEALCESINTMHIIPNGRMAPPNSRDAPLASATTFYWRTTGTA
jgi:hypothetical protein